MAGLPEDVIYGVPKVVLVGEERLLVENHEGIVEYGRERVRVRTSCGLLEVEGLELSLNHLGAGDLLVQGRVTRVGYMRR
jgi:sporulation protein YqfC